jgi:selT/selW/selH-like putative selenoprotein
VEAELRADYPDSLIELIKGSGGIFEVKYNDRLIYSKHHAEGQRFPNVGEVSKLIKREVER